MTRKPIKRFLPLTYAPKIQGVLAGTIEQSIRINTNLQVGDSIAFHGWSGKPYYSPWSFRTPYMVLRHAEPIIIRKDSIYFSQGKIGIVPCKVAVKACDLDHLAALDGIEPATGEELIRVLHSMHGMKALHGKILRWDASTLRRPDFIIKPDPTQIDSLGRIRMCEGDFTQVRSSRLTPPSQDFVQIGDIQKTRRDNPAVLQ